MNWRSSERPGFSLAFSAAVLLTGCSSRRSILRIVYEFRSYEPDRLRRTLDLLLDWIDMLSSIPSDSIFGGRENELRGTGVGLTYRSAPQMIIGKC